MNALGRMSDFNMVIAGLLIVAYSVIGYCAFMISVFSSDKPFWKVVLMALIAGPMAWLFIVIYYAVAIPFLKLFEFILGDE